MFPMTVAPGNGSEGLAQGWTRLPTDDYEYQFQRLCDIIHLCDWMTEILLHPHESHHRLTSHNLPFVLEEATFNYSVFGVRAEG